MALKVHYKEWALPVTDDKPHWGLTVTGEKVAFYRRFGGETAEKLLGSADASLIKPGEIYRIDLVPLIEKETFLLHKTMYHWDSRTYYLRPVLQGVNIAVLVREENGDLQLFLTDGGRYLADAYPVDYLIPWNAAAYTNMGYITGQSAVYAAAWRRYEIKAAWLQEVDAYDNLAYLETQVDLLTAALLNILPKGSPQYQALAWARENSSVKDATEEQTLSKVFGDKKSFRRLQQKYKERKEQANIPPAVGELPPPPTEEEITAAAMAHFDYFVKKHLDAWANTRQYDGIDSLVLYANDNEPNQIWRTEGARGVRMKSLTWAKCLEIMAAVLSGEREIPTEEGLLAELPALTWEDETGE
jgi:hypothetical protein